MEYTIYGKFGKGEPQLVISEIVDIKGKVLLSRSHSTQSFEEGKLLMYRTARGIVYTFRAAANENFLGWADAIESYDEILGGSSSKKASEEILGEDNVVNDIYKVKNEAGKIKAVAKKDLGTPIIKKFDQMLLDKLKADVIEKHGIEMTVGQDTIYKEVYIYHPLSN